MAYQTKCAIIDNSSITVMKKTRKLTRKSERKSRKKNLEEALCLQQQLQGQKHILWEDRDRRVTHRQNKEPAQALSFARIYSIEIH